MYILWALIIFAIIYGAKLLTITMLYNLLANRLWLATISVRSTFILRGMIMLMEEIIQWVNEGIEREEGL